MSKYLIFTLKVLRKIYVKLLGKQELPFLSREENPDTASDMIYELLNSGEPCMIARYGSTELIAVVNYLGVKQKNRDALSYIRGEMLDWWWNDSILQQMQRWSGFFPPTPEKISQFCELMLEDSKQVDILGSWLQNENYMLPYLKDVNNRVRLIYLEPYWSSNPWSRVLADKKVLVVHPFAELILEQYHTKRELLFEDKNVLPKFKSLTVVKAIQSLGGVDNGFQDWFEALDHMKHEISKVDYDICLLGCGAYGFPLAAHIKRQGKQAVHLGGSLQLLFGIRGKRWESEDYTKRVRHVIKKSYPDLMNEHWVRPDVYKNKKSESVEGGCYW